MNKTKTHLHMFSKKIKLTHHCFKSSPLICIGWIDRVGFLYFLANKIHISLTGVVSSFSLPGAASPLANVVTSCHTSFPWSQDELTAYISSFGNASSHRLHLWLSFSFIIVLHPSSIRTMTLMMMN
jgi:hypothetical protein